MTLKSPQILQFFTDCSCIDKRFGYDFENFTLPERVTNVPEPKLESAFERITVSWEFSKKKQHLNLTKFIQHRTTSLEDQQKTSHVR